jgi:hypothetical protein
MTFTVIVRKDGIDRHYHCANQFDAEVLYDALTRGMKNAVIEAWRGAERLVTYRND